MCLQDCDGFCLAVIKITAENAWRNSVQDSSGKGQAVQNVRGHVLMYSTSLMLRAACCVFSQSQMFETYASQHPNPIWNHSQNRNKITMKVTP